MPESLPPANPVGDDEFGVGQSLEDLFSGGWANPMDPHANWDATTPFMSESQNVAGSSLPLPHFGVDPPNMGSYTRVTEPPRGDRRVRQDFVAPQGAEQYSLPQASTANPVGAVARSTPIDPSPFAPPFTPNVFSMPDPTPSSNSAPVSQSESTLTPSRSSRSGRSVVSMASSLVLSNDVHLESSHSSRGRSYRSSSTRSIRPGQSGMLSPSTHPGTLLPQASPTNAVARSMLIDPSSFTASLTPANFATSGAASSSNLALSPNAHASDTDARHTFNTNSLLKEVEHEGRRFCQLRLE